MIKNKPLALAFLVLNIVPMTALRLLHHVSRTAERLSLKIAMSIEGFPETNILWAILGGLCYIPVILLMAVAGLFYYPSWLSIAYHGWVTKVANVKLHWKKP